MNVGLLGKRVCIVFLAILFFNFLYAQTGTLRGNVYDQETGAPIIYGNVLLEGTTLGSTTNDDGFYNISNVPVGDYNLVATYLGYDSTAIQVTIKANAITYQRITLSENAINLGVVDVSASKEKARSDVQVSKVTVTAKQIKSLPSAGGEADIAQYLSVLPGVIFTGDQGGQLYIRGGSPIQNKVLLDGMTIYNPFHSIGFFSVFETEAIKSVDVLTGGFNAEYGNRISAIVDIKTREGNKKRFGGVLSTSPFQSKALLEGPIKKLKDDGGGSISYLFTGKHSYIDQTSKTLYSYVNDTTGLPYNFTDLYGKVSFVAGSGSKLNLFGFNFRDNVNFAGIADLGWVASGGGANFTLIPPSTDMVIGGTVAYSSYDLSLLEDDPEPRSSGINGFTAALDFTSFGKNNEVKYGFQINGFNTKFRFKNFLDLIFEQEDFTTEIGGFFKYKQKLDKLILEPSLRVQYYASLSDFSVEPRFGLKYNITNRVRFKLAGGLYSQNLISTVNERDVVNLFVGFLSGPEEKIFTPDQSEQTKDRLQKSIHGIAGVELDITNDLTLNIEPYYKGFTQLINVNRNKTVATDPDYVTETGEAYGLDFLLKYQTRKVYIWATYSLGYVNRDDGTQVYPTIFDRRHNVNLLGTYTFGSALDWEASARWNLGSGFPFTLTQGFYNLQDFQDGISTDVLTSNGDLGILFPIKEMMVDYPIITD